ncbi:unnamed protein product [Ambrosiozyma monospora]|uniref:Unnamed protein product n=1 Tax=Ambrosiozyma monospora TaxID=43982 RepID=A0A9W6Z319_AMBMO|nr:unnamed protein product [Ambrosiozyma monospora]
MEEIKKSAFSPDLAITVHVAIQLKHEQVPHRRTKFPDPDRPFFVYSYVNWNLSFCNWCRSTRLTRSRCPTYKPCRKCKATDHNKLHCDKLTEAQKSETLAALPRPLIKKVQQGPVELCPIWLLPSHESSSHINMETNGTKRRIISKDNDDALDSSDDVSPSNPQSYVSQYAEQSNPIHLIQLHHPNHQLPLNERNPSIWLRPILIRS